MTSSITEYVVSVCRLVHQNIDGVFQELKALWKEMVRTALSWISHLEEACRSSD